jgi:hypothetical protein
MKYLLLVYRDKSIWEAMSNGERTLFEQKCRANEELLQQSGHLLAVECVPSSTVTVQVLEGALCVLEGALDEIFGEIKQALSGVYVIDARDLNKAIYVASKMPQVRCGPIEVRPLTNP